MRLYKKTYNLRQICNIAVYMVHSACTIHMLNLPEKTAKRDIIHGVRQLEEIAEDWPCARRTLGILSVLARKWNVEMPEEAATVLQRTDEKYGTFSTTDVPSPNRTASAAAAASSPQAPGRSPVTKTEHYSPITNQSNQPTPPPMPPEVRIGSISPDMLAMASQVQQPQLAKPMAQAVPSATMSMDEALSAVANPWTMPSQPMASFAQQAFAPMPGSNSTSGPSTQSGTRQVSPNSLYAIDGSDWYLKDGVSWQQNFEAWNAAGASGGGGAGMADGSMFMFRGLRGGNEFDSGAFDSLDTSMGSLDHLPGLD